MRALLAAFAGLVLIAGCTSTDVAPIEADLTPEIDTDEAGLWLRMDEFEEKLAVSALVVRDEQLNDYVHGVYCRISGPNYCDDVRIYIVEQPYFNANMSPNGMMNVWTGLLLRAENEAQLAFVLGHEFAHYRERHSLEQWRDMKNAANASLFFTLGVAFAGVPEAAVLGDFTLAAQMYGYGRDKEREADEQGFRSLVEAGYDPGAAAAIWDYLISEIEASDSDRKKRRNASASIFSTHPLTAERVETLEEYAADLPEGAHNEEIYAAMIAPFLESWLEDDLVRRDFGEHLHLIDHKIATGENLGILYYRKGEALRMRREEGDLEAALEAYREAVGFDEAPAAAWRGLGEALMRKGDTLAGRAALATYLERDPAAPDRLLIESILEDEE